jgi:outer membrane protein assembly factor BamB
MCRTLLWSIAWLKLVFVIVVVRADDAAPSKRATPTDNSFLPLGVSDRGWPFVRGPAFDGHSSETHLANEWPKAGPPVLWTRELGQGYSAIVAVGRRCFTQTQSIAGQFVVCLDADTGETIWEHRYDLPYELVGVYPGPRATPTISRGRVYFAAPSGLIGCLSAETGQPLWSVNVVEKYHGQGAEFGYSCSPTVVDGLVLLPVGGPGASMVALNAEDGREVWKSGDDSASYTPAYPIERDGRPLVVGYLQNALVICDRRDGRQLARFELSQGYDEHSAWPLYREPLLWISHPFKAGSILLEVPAFDEDSPVQRLSSVRRSPRMSNDILSSVLIGEHIYGFDLFEAQAKTHRASRGIFRCLDFESGNEKWSVGTGRPRRDNGSQEAASSEIGQAGIVVADGKLILLNELGELILLRATSERCEELARASVLSGEIVWTPPTLHRGRVYVRNHSRAACIYVGEPALLNADRPTITVADIPQRRYRDWAATILAIEPEFAFDIPSNQWLLRWFVVGVGLLLIGQVIGIFVDEVVRLRRSVKTNLNSREFSDGNLVSRGVVFVSGCLGTTFLSGWANDFMFTWPVSLFLAFEIAASQLRSRSVVVSGQQRWRERLNLWFWLLTMLIYFLICRRLSLVFEWAFLIGPLGAWPIQIWANHWRQQHPLVTWRGRVWLATLQVLTFAGFFAAAVLELRWKY